MVRVNLDPVVGSEVGKTRPAVVLQNELARQLSSERLEEIHAALDRHLWF